eukprot:Sspe_Gene.117731::Locus_109592_Transcript_1_1_Confidence_1.000_Length_1467::g.117731::m.117731
MFCRGARGAVIAANGAAKRLPAASSTAVATRAGRKRWTEHCRQCIVRYYSTSMRSSAEVLAQDCLAEWRKGQIAEAGDALMHACSQLSVPSEERIAQARAALSTIEKTGVQPTVRHWTTLLSICCKAKNPDEMDKVWRAMRLANVQPTGLTYSLYVQSFYLRLTSPFEKRQDDKDRWIAMAEEVLNEAVEAALAGQVVSREISVVFETVMRCYGHAEKDTRNRKAEALMTRVLNLLLRDFDPHPTFVLYCEITERDLDTEMMRTLRRKQKQPRKQRSFGTDRDWAADFHRKRLIEYTFNKDRKKLFTALSQKDLGPFKKRGIKTTAMVFLWLGLYGGPDEAMKFYEGLPEEARGTLEIRNILMAMHAMAGNKEGIRAVWEEIKPTCEDFTLTVPLRFIEHPLAGDAPYFLLKTAEEIGVPITRADITVALRGCRKPKEAEQLFQRCVTLINEAKLKDEVYEDF